jgi:hypothetical protein
LSPWQIASGPSAVITGCAGKALTVRVASADRSLLTVQFVASQRYLKVPVAVMPDTPKVAVVALV